MHAAARVFYVVVQRLFSGAVPMSWLPGRDAVIAEVVSCRCRGEPERERKGLYAAQCSVLSRCFLFPGREASCCLTTVGDCSSRIVSDAVVRCATPAPAR